MVFRSEGRYAPAGADTRGFADLVSQLRRSAASVPANILEASGERRAGKKLNYLLIAKGSIWECWAHMDSLVDFGLVEEAATAVVRSYQYRITALLITSIRSLESDSRPPREPRRADGDLNLNLNENLKRL